MLLLVLAQYSLNIRFVCVCYSGEIFPLHDTVRQHSNFRNFKKIGITGKPAC